jgi:hypothetical protein
MADKKTPKAKAGVNVDVMPHAILITLDKKQQDAMKRCLAKTGSISMSFEELKVTELPSIAARMPVPTVD